MLAVLLLLLLFAGYCLAEYLLHVQRLSQIPVRVQVNGTRGKSSVTRLIAAGLRAGGLRTVAKVTGTKPRFITGDNDEVAVRRLGKANIAEQLRIVLLARERQAEALVVENMSLDPLYQRVENHLLNRPTHSVVTNVRADHLDVMGPTVRDIARAFNQTLRDGHKLFTAEQRYFGDLVRGRKVQAVQARAETVSDEEMAGFSYFEHKENVALALAVCADLGVERALALAGMKRSLPDSGVLRVHRLVLAGRRLDFVNALAANDPDSIGMIWRMVADRYQRRLVLVNCRDDRQDRSRQMAELVRGFDAERYIATGGLVSIFLRRAAELGIPADKLVDIGGDREPAEVVSRIAELAPESALLFACGNTVGYGYALTDCLVKTGNHEQTKAGGRS